MSSAESNDLASRIQELEDQLNELDDEIESLEAEGESVPQMLLDQQEALGRKIQLLDAELTRRNGGYSAVVRITDEELQYDDTEEHGLKATDPEAAREEAESGARAMASVTGMKVEVESIKGPLS